jgi:hypothetical protein
MCDKCGAAILARESGRMMRERLMATIKEIAHRDAKVMLQVIFSKISIACEAMMAVPFRCITTDEAHNDSGTMVW